MACKKMSVVYYQEYSEIGQSGLQHTIGRELLKFALDQEYRITFSEEMLCYTDSGKPMLKSIQGQEPVYFNISHCKGVVACALADCPIGIDVECSRRVTDRMIRQACSEQEKQYIFNHDMVDGFLELWTLKESYLKMTGEGLRIPVKQVNFSFAEASRGTAYHELGSESRCTPTEIQSNREGYYYQTKLNNRFILAVCLKEPCSEPQIIKVS